VTAGEGVFADAEFLRTLAYLDLTAKQIRAGARRGERPSHRKGTGTIFRDHRAYTRGDDPRYVDWNVYGRLGALVVKEFEVEESLDVLLYLDRSLSMDFGRPTKLAFARRIAAALGYIGLSHLDRVEVVPVPGDEPRAFSGKRQAPALFSHLLELEPEGEADLAAAAERERRRRGVAVLLSDLTDPEGYRRAVEHLRARRNDVFLVHVVSPEEADPPGRGALRLVDSETGRTRDVRLTDRLAAEYREEFRRFCSRAEAFALKKEIGLARFRSDLPFGPAVLEILRRGGVLR